MEVLKGAHCKELIKEEEVEVSETLENTAQNHRYQNGKEQGQKQAKKQILNTPARYARKPQSKKKAQEQKS